MKRVTIWALITMIVALITFNVGLKVATDRHKGFECRDWITDALRDAKLEASFYKDADLNYNVEFNVFLAAMSTGVYYEGRNFLVTPGQAPSAASARPAPHRICAQDYSGSAEWNKYQSAGSRGTP